MESYSSLSAYRRVTVTKMGLFLPRSCIHLATSKLRVTTIARPRMMGMTSAISKHVRGSREHVSVSLTPEEKIRVDDQIFFEEPLGLPAWDSFGWPQLEFNQAIGPDDRYVICRKLGWGIHSSTWLARDKINNSFVAVKISTGAATGLVREHNHWEIPTLYRVSSPPNSHCLRNLSHFTMPGKGSSGEHVCSVTQILGGSLIDLRKTHGPILPLPLAKRILLHTLRGIAHIHSRGAVHTNLCLDAIFLDAHISNSDIEKLLESDPSRRHPPEESYDGIMQAAVSQPLPVPTLQEAMQRTFVLAKFRYSLPIGAAADEINSYDHLRPPESFIGGLWEEQVDIWTFGCLIFELVTDHALFKFQPWPLLGLDETDHILWQMISYTGETFHPVQFVVSQRAADSFSATCRRLRRSNPPLRRDHIERCLRCYKGVEEQDIVSTAAVIRRCLRLDLADRPSAAELLTDPWFAEVDPV